MVYNPASTPESRSHASLLLDHVAMLPNRAATGEMDNLSMLDHLSNVGVTSLSTSRRLHDAPRAGQRNRR